MMGLKSIFREGMKERQRKKSLRSEKNEFKSKEKSYAGQLTAIGKKAWEAKTDISAFGDLRSALSETQKALDDLQLQVKDLQEQKKAAAELDQKIASLNKALTANVSKRTEAEKALNQNFFHLGEKLSAASPPDQNLAKEISAAQNVKAEMEGIQALIGGLERQKDKSQVSAYKKMVAIIIAGAVLIAAIIILLFILLSPKDI